MTERRGGDTSVQRRPALVAAEKERIVAAAMELGGSCVSARPRGRAPSLYARSCAATVDRRGVAKLHLPFGGKYFGSREGYGPTYTSCQESGKFRGLLVDAAVPMIRRRTGFFAKTKRSNPTVKGP